MIPIKVKYSGKKPVTLTGMAAKILIIGTILNNTAKSVHISHIILDGKIYA